MTEVRIKTRIAAPPGLVWTCLTDPAAVRQWFGPHMTLDARPGGGFREVWHDGGREVVTSGRVLEIEAGRRLVLSWADEDWPAATTVTLALAAEGEGTRLELVHSGWAALGSEGEGLAAAHRAGWQAHLDALVEHAGRAARTLA